MLTMTHALSYLGRRGEQASMGAAYTENYRDRPASKKGLRTGKAKTKRQSAAPMALPARDYYMETGTGF